jgi:phage gp36-like protein
MIPSADLIELFDDDDDSSVDTTIFDAMVTRIESQFHNYVSRRYSIPLDVTDTTVLASAQFYCSRLFEYHAHARRQSVTPEMLERYNKTLEELEMIRDGRQGLNDPPPSECSTTGGQYTAEDDDRDFTPTTMKDFGGGASR